MDYNVENIVNPEKIKKVFESDIFLSFIVFFLIIKIFSIISVIDIPHIPNNIFFADVTRGALENLVNNERTHMGLTPLIENAKLDIAAHMKVEDMVKKGYFDHISPEGITPWQWITQAGYKYKYAGENLAVGFYDSNDVFQAWFNSPSHKENFLNPNYKEFGTAVASGFGDNKVNIVVQLFATPSSEVFIASQQPKNIQNDKSITISPKNDAVSDVKGDAENPTVLGENSQVASNTQISPDTILGISQLVDDFSYLFFVLAIGSLVLLIISNFHIQNKAEFYSKKFIFRCIAIMAFLILSLLIDKDFIISIIPNQIII